MIIKIRAKNVGIIPFVDIDLKSGLNVITGETGAGKTLFTRALLACFGFQSLSDLQLEPDAETFVEILFENRESESGYSVIRREMKNGRTFSYVDDRLASNEKLREIFDNRLVVLAQHSSIALLKKEKQRSVLDSFDEETTAAYTRFHESFSKLKELKNELNSLLAAREDAEKRYEMMRYQLNELKAADLKRDEDVELEDYIRKVKNSARIAEAVFKSVELIKEGDRSVIENLGEACAEIERIKEFDTRAIEILGQLYGIQSQLEDLVLELKSIFDVQNISMEELEQAESRLFMIQELKRKYGRDLNSLISLREELESKLQEDGSITDMIEKLNAEIHRLEAQVDSLASELSKKRQTTAVKLQSAVNTVLNELNMGSVEFRVNLKPVPTGVNGKEEVIFEIRNKGGKFNPIDSSISGGELSRLLLAIESASVDSTEVFVFDEVDAGIGGDTAIQVGKYLKKLARRSQVIVVTHLPQIAAYAENHIFVEKKDVNGKVTAVFKVLENDEIVKEIARMLSGSAVRNKAEEHALNLIEYARNTQV